MAPPPLARLRKGSFLGEWARGRNRHRRVALATAWSRGLMTPQAPLGLTLIQLILTIALYPVVAGVAHVALGLRAPAQGEVDALGTPAMKRPRSDSNEVWPRMTRRAALWAPRSSASWACWAGA
jgi:hypothetical protein